MDRESKHNLGVMDYLVSGIIGAGAAVAAAVRTVDVRYYEDTKRGSTKLTAMQDQYEKTLLEINDTKSGQELVDAVAAEKARHNAARTAYFEGKVIHSTGWKGLTSGTWQRMRMMGFANSMQRVGIASGISGIVAGGATLTFFNNRHARRTLDELKSQVDAQEAARRDGPGR